MIFLVIILSLLVAGALLWFNRGQPADLTTYQKSAASSSVAKYNSWFAGAYAFPSEPLFALPGAYKFSRDGLEVSVPQVGGAEKVVTGGFERMCVVSGGGRVSDTKVLGYGDFDVDVQLDESDQKWAVNLVQGMPVVYISNLSELTMKCAEGATVTQNNNQLVVTQGSRVILVQAQEQTGLQMISPNEYQLISKSGSYRLSILPNQEAVDLFSRNAWNQIRNTKVSWSDNTANGSVETKFEWQKDHATPVLTTVWPHQKANLKTSQTVLGKYPTVFGVFDLVQVSSLELTNNLPQLADQFVKVTNPVQAQQIRAQIQLDAKPFLDGKTAFPVGVYGRGVWLGSVASLIQLADLYELTSERNQLLDLLGDKLVPGLREFEYDSQKMMWVSKSPEYGNEFGNDHHFHYGYYIRASAILVKYRPSTYGLLQKNVTEMINDIANTDNQSSRYPVMRHLSVYEGHSWADARAKFADGNNQESSSEAMNAWYAIYLWGKNTTKPSVESLGRWLYSQELVGVKSYWFGQDNPFTDNYGRQIASIVWGGKREFGTWFSAEPMHIYGIQWLPITPASSYLGELTNSARYFDEVAKIQSNYGGHEWIDLYLAAMSYTDPQKAAQMLKVRPNGQGMKIKSLLYQVVYQNLEQKS